MTINTQMAFKAKNVFGDQLFQQRGRKALPILISQALAKTPITYSDLAKQLGVPNPRNMNDVLGAVGTTLVELGEEWGAPVPMLQTLVYNKNTGIPGKGIDVFFVGKTYSQMTKQDKRRLIDDYAKDVYNYEDWPMPSGCMIPTISKMTPCD